MPTTKKALSLLEILVSMLIFSLIMGGVVTLFMASRRHILRSRSRMVQGGLARYFLDRLQMQVRQDAWDTPSNYLTIDEYRSPNNPFPDYASYTPVLWLDEPNLDNITYYSAQRVEAIAGTTLRKVRLTISYPATVYE